MPNKARRYPEADQTPNFPQIEREILDRWERDGTFEKQVAGRPKLNPDGSSNEFGFYDGPPSRTACRTTGISPPAS
jgi:isoleucyl-tRNA synthetase